jgi:hypothetical protein
MRDAGYVRLISWTLQSGSEQEGQIKGLLSQHVTKRKES